MLDPTATPTLVGLRLTSEACRPEINAVYPWRQLEWNRGDGTIACWRVCDKAGQPLLLEGHPLVLTVRGKRAVQFARLAEQRAFRNAWAAGDVLVRADRISRAEQWSFLGFMAFFSAVAVPLWLKVQLESAAWVEYASMNTQARAAVLLSAGLFVLFLIVPLLGVVFGGLALRRSQIVSLQLDPRSIKARLRCGADLELAWTDVADLQLGKIVRVQLKDGQTVWLGPLPCSVRTKLSWLREERFPDSVKRDKRRNRRANLILAAFSLMAAAATGLAIGYLGQQPGQPANVARFFGPALACVGLISAVLLLYFAQGRASRQKRRRRR